MRRRGDKIMANPQRLSPQLTLSQTFFRPAQAIRSQPVKWETGGVMSECMVRGRRCRWPIAAAALPVAGLGLVAAPAAATEAEAASRDADAQARGAIAVQGNRRVDADTVRSYFHAAP